MSARDLNILVVDDDDFLRATTRMMLRKFSAASILEAANGMQALEVLRRAEGSPVDLVLCDLNMPEMDGMEFLRHLGEAHSNVSVIIISSHDDTLISSVRKMAAAYGVHLLGAAQKPVSSERLEALILEFRAAQPVAAFHRAAGPSFTLDQILQGVAAKQFVPFFQPKVSFKTGAVCGAEALARWMHPDHGVVAPYAFIETLENSGNIDGLTFLILEQAAAACRKFHEDGLAISVSVNLSLNSLGDPKLAEKITQTVKDAGADPKFIILEVTESATMKNVAHSLENLARLRMHGFGLSVDDYGTGSSNIQQLTRVAFSELKIDQSFVKNCADNKELGVIVRSSIDMAHRLKMPCTAEGVETRSDWDALRDMDCDVAQGYYISRPVSLADFQAFCQKHSPEALLRG